MTAASRKEVMRTPKVGISHSRLIASTASLTGQRSRKRASGLRRLPVVSAGGEGRVAVVVIGSPPEPGTGGR